MITLIRACGGLLIWATAFSVMYGFHGLGCARGWATIPVAGTSLHLLAMGGVWIVGLVSLILYGRAVLSTGEKGGTPSLMDRLAGGLAVVGFVSLIVTGGPILLYPACL